MKTLYMTKGLPGSGKTTWAKKQQAIDSNIVRVNKDDLRAMLHNSKYSRHNEKQVLSLRDYIIRNALKDGRHVIVDDTNYCPKHEKTLKGIASEYDAQFRVMDFSDTPVETCIERDAKRENPVGKKVIMDMYKKYLKPEPPVILYDDSLEDAFIVDIDGTVALMKNRSAYEWNRVGEDEPNENVVKVVKALGGYYRIIFLSGRDSVCKPETIKWLEKYFFEYGYHGPYMRPEGDNRSDEIVKGELYKEHVEGKYNIIAVLDDRDRMVKYWRSLGLTCLQVAEGDF